jgi:hypothetical protein
VSRDSHNSRLLYRAVLVLNVHLPSVGLQVGPAACPHGRMPRATNTFSANQPSHSNPSSQPTPPTMGPRMPQSFRPPLPKAWSGNTRSTWEGAGCLLYFVDRSYSSKPQWIAGRGSYGYYTPGIKADISWWLPIPGMSRSQTVGAYLRLRWTGLVSAGFVNVWGEESFIACRPPVVGVLVFVVENFVLVSADEWIGGSAVVETLQMFSTYYGYDCQRPSGV